MPNPIETINQKIRHTESLLSLLDTFGKDDVLKRTRLVEQIYWLEIEKEQLLEKEVKCKSAPCAEQK